MSDHHTLDVWPLPREKKPMFISEPWLIDQSIYFETWGQAQKARDPENEEDNRRVYIPIDLNKSAFLRRLEYVLNKYDDITWKNESAANREVWGIVSQIEIYDQLWFVREGRFQTDEHGMITGHSEHAKEVVKEFIARLEQVETCEDFPYDVIEELKKEYLAEE